jgi:hypothetical protein
VRDAIAIGRLGTFAVLRFYILHFAVKKLSATCKAAKVRDAIAIGRLGTFAVLRFYILHFAV